MTELKNNIIALCNQSGLSIEQVMFVLRDAYRDAEDSFTVYEAKKEAKKKQQEEKPQEEIEQED